MRIDMHLHSRQSKRPSQWILQKINCPESFSEPMVLYRLRRRQGMNLFTLTDHNTLQGALELAHLPDVFISEEVTTYFPEDGCKIHVLVYDIGERIHEDIQKIRENIYDLAAYLNREGIVHAVAHPLFSVNDRLTLDHFEKLLLLFRIFELNGARDEVQNQLIGHLPGHLNREDIDDLANRHDLAPQLAEPWKKGVIGGSDDHSALNVARMYTEAAKASSRREFLDAVSQGRAEAKGRSGTALGLARTLYSIAYQFFHDRLGLGGSRRTDSLPRFLQRLLAPVQGSRTDGPVRRKASASTGGILPDPGSLRLEEVIRREGERAITGNPDLAAMIQRGVHEARNRDEHWFTFINQVSNNVLAHLSRDLLGHLAGANLLSIFTTLGAAGALYGLMAPYLIAFGLFRRERRLIEAVRTRFSLPEPDGIPERALGAGAEKDLRVAHFTDTFFEINGVARTLAQQARLAAEKNLFLEIITSAVHRKEAGEFAEPGRVRVFDPIEAYDLPVYKEMKLAVPPFLEMLKYVYDAGFTHIHSATPGPMGLAALAVSRILKLPISGTYHTAIPQYAARLTKDESLEAYSWRFVIWYYAQMDFVYVPSLETGRELIAKGLPAEKVAPYPRGVDADRFHPRHGGDFYEHRYGLPPDSLVLLYVGRVSREKNLAQLAEAFRAIQTVRPECTLAVVGDGPYREEMAAELKGWPCLFTGYLDGDDLAAAYASADLFVFPSTTDTFGNVILEAQASGLPVVVTDGGGPRENMRPGQTGWVVPGDNAMALAEAVLQLLRSPEKLRDMAQRAREYAAQRSFEHAFMDQWRLYARPVPTFTGDPVPLDKAHAA